MSESSKAKFTKGPWEVDQQVNKINWILSAEDDFNKAVAKVTQYGSSDVAIMNANAHLIAAAPEMYDVLSTIENDDGTIPKWLWDKIQLVLAKARGE